MKGGKGERKWKRRKEERENIFLKERRMSHEVQWKRAGKKLAAAGKLTKEGNFC